MKKKMKITIIAAVIVILITIVCSISSVSGTEAFGLFEEPSMTVYSLDNRTKTIEVSEFGEYHKVGWYSEPVMRVYNIEQQVTIITVANFDFYHQYGWYSEPVMKVYDINGEEYIICQKDLEYYKNSGYYTEKPSYNYNDMILLAKVIYAEATENPNLRVTDRRYVGAVVMNRVRSSKFPNSISGVVYQRGQYACVGTGKFNSYPPEECQTIAKQLLMGETFGVPSGVVFQAQFRQGSGVWCTVGVHYYCYI